MKVSNARRSVFNVPLPACWNGTASSPPPIVRKKAMVFRRCSRVSWETNSRVDRPSPPGAMYSASRASISSEDRPQFGGVRVYRWVEGSQSSANVLPHSLARLFQAQDIVEQRTALQAQRT